MAFFFQMQEEGGGVGERSGRIEKDLPAHSVGRHIIRFAFDADNQIGVSDRDVHIGTERGNYQSPARLEHPVKLPKRLLRIEQVRQDDTAQDLVELLVFKGKRHVARAVAEIEPAEFQMAGVELRIVYLSVMEELLVQLVVLKI